MIEGGMRLNHESLSKMMVMTTCFYSLTCSKYFWFCCLKNLTNLTDCLMTMMMTVMTNSTMVKPCMEVV